eukprot:CFRG5520T1
MAVSMAPDLKVRYEYQEQIGKGSFGRVYKCSDTRTDRIVAIKVIDLEEASDEIDDIQQEISVMAKCDSPYITKYYESCLSQHELWIVMEYMGGGSCSDLLKVGPMDEMSCAIVLRDVIHGLDYLHSMRLLHRDVKAANVLLSRSGDVKLADFGVAGQLSGTIAKRNTFVGTPFWMAPEVIKQSAYNSKADIWSLGITALEMATGKAPHSELHPMRVLFLIPKNPPPTLDGDKFSKLFKEFVAVCLQAEPDDRPLTKELLKHKFVKSAKKNAYLIELITTTCNRRRSSVDEATIKESSRVLSNNDEWDFDTVRGSVSTVPVSEDHERISRVNPTATTNTPPKIKSPVILGDLQLFDAETDMRILNDENKQIIIDGETTVDARGVARRPSILDLNNTEAERRSAGSPSIRSSPQPSTELFSVFDKLCKENASCIEATAAINTLSEAFLEAERLKPGFSGSVYTLLCSKPGRNEQ